MYSKYDYLEDIHRGWRKARIKRLYPEVNLPNTRPFSGPSIYTPKGYLRRDTFKAELSLNPRDEEFINRFWDFFDINGPLAGMSRNISRTKFKQYFQPTYAFGLEADAVVAAMEFGLR